MCTALNAGSVRSPRLAAAALMLMLSALPVLTSADVPDSAQAVPPPMPDSAQPPEPAMDPGVIYLVEGSQLRKLESIPLDKDTSSGGLGVLMSVATLTDVTGAQYWGVLDGWTSETRLADPQPHFRVQLEKAKALSIRLGRFALAGKKRRARIEPVHPVDFFQGKFRVDLTATKLDQDIYDLTPTKPLKPGEYALVFSASGPAVDFTIAEAKK